MSSVVKGWIVRLKNWHVGLWIEDFAGAGNSTRWTAKREKAMRWEHKSEALYSLKLAGENQDGCVVHFVRKP